MSLDEDLVNTVLQKASPYTDALTTNASKYNLDLPTILAQLYQESRFNPNAQSPAGASGIAQFMPGTAKQYGLTNPQDPNASITAQAQLMSDLTKQNGGDTSLALAGYNAGQGNVNKYGGIPPFKETQDYVKKITTLAEAIRNQAGGTSASQVNPNVAEGLSPQQVASDAGVDTSAKKKSNVMDILSGISAALGGLGGVTANIIGGIKRSGSPGDSAIAASTGILGSLQAERDKQQKQDQINSFLNSSNADPQAKKTAAFLASTGDLKGAADVINAPYALQQKIGSDLAIKKAEATDPTLIKAAQDAKSQDLQGQIQKELAVSKAKSDYDRQLKQGDFARYNELTSKTDLTPTEDAEKKSLENSLKIKVDDPLKDIKVRSLAEKTIETIAPSVSLRNDLQILSDSLDQVSTGRLAGKATKFTNLFSGDPKFARAQGAMGRLLSNFSRTVGGEKGVLTDEDINRIKVAIGDETRTPEERKVLLQDALSSIDMRISGAAKLASFSAQTDLSPLIADYYNLPINILKGKSGNIPLKPSDVKNTSPQTNNQQNQSSTQKTITPNSIDEYAKSLGATIRKN